MRKNKGYGARYHGQTPLLNRVLAKKARVVLFILVAVLLFLLVRFCL